MGKFFKKKKDLFTPEQRAAYAANQQQHQGQVQKQPEQSQPQLPLARVAQKKCLNSIVKTRFKTQKATRAPLEATATERRDAEMHYPPMWCENGAPEGRFIKQHDKCFDRLISHCYNGFVVEGAMQQADDFTDDGLHETFANAFEAMDKQGVFRKDVTQPMGLGTACAPTAVWRTLVGDMGMSYKYLGIRMFAHPWNVASANCIADEAVVALLASCGFVVSPGLGKSKKTKKQKTKAKLDEISPWAQEVGIANALLRDRAQMQLHYLIAQRREAATKAGKPANNSDSSEAGHVGSAEFNVALINRGVPVTETPHLKPDPTFGDLNDRVAVSWHADSSLEPYSTISVYHREQPLVPIVVREKAQIESASWRIALRVAPDSEGPGKDVSKRPKSWKRHAKASQAPKVVVPLLSGDVYHMLDSFNHHHQHCVFAGGTHRYGSTHRVVSKETCSVFEILKSAVRVLESAQNVCGSDHLASDVTREGAQHPRKRQRRSVSPVLNDNFEETRQRWSTEQNMLNTIEFEWLRQWYVQGEAHDKLHRHVFWDSALRALGQLWARLEECTASHVEELRVARQSVQGAVDSCNSKLAIEKLSASLREELSQRARLREGWLARERDPFLTSRKRPVDERPLCPPFRFSADGGVAALGESAGTFSDHTRNRVEWPPSPLPYNLAPLVTSLSRSI